MEIEPDSLVAVARSAVFEDAQWATEAARALGGGETLAAAMLTSYTLRLLDDTLCGAAEAAEDDAG
jgi:hypothetical protein